MRGGRDGCPLFFLNQVARGDPGSSHRRHILQGQVAGKVALIQAAEGDVFQIKVCVGGRHGTQVGHTADRFGREKFEQLAAKLGGTFDVRGSDNTRREGQTGRLRRTNDVGIESWSDCKCGASSDSLVHLLSRQHRAQARHHIRIGFADAAQGFKSCGSAKCQFDRRDSPGQQGLSQRRGIIRIVDDHNSDDF